MQMRKLKTNHLLWALSAPLVLMLGACGSAQGNITPTLSVDAIFTAAHETFSAQQATQLALTPPTGTPSPTLFPTLPVLSPIATFSFGSPTPGGAASLCDNAVFAGDVTVPDGTTMKASQKFVKTWKLLNKGSCTWSTSYQLAFVSGDTMGGTTTLVAVPISSGSVGDISVNMTAPTAAGTYKGNWRMQNDKSQPFGDTIYVQIKVGTGGATETPGPSPTVGPSATAGAGTVTISGNAEKPDVLITYTGTGGSESGSTTADAAGDYAFSVPSGWSGTVTPSKGIWTFDPVSRSYTNVTADSSGQDYTAQ